MGIHDREYYKESSSGIFLGGPRLMVTNLVIINVAVFLADKLLFDGKLYETAGLRPDLAEKPWYAWQLLSYGFLHDTSGIGHVLMNMLALWFFGRDVEALHGPKQFLSFYLTGTIISGIGWLVTEKVFFHGTMPLVGASGAVCAVLVVFVIHYPMRTLYVMGVIPLPAWLLAVIYIGGDLLMFRDAVHTGSQSDNVARSAHLVGAAYGALYWKTRWSLIRLLPERFTLKKLSLRPRPKLRVHEPSWENEGDFQTRMDEILDKIKQEGMSSLTADEQRFMEEASRRLQRKRR